MSQLKIHDIPADVYPVIFKIVNDVEFQLSELLGSKVTMKLELGESTLTKSDALKMRLQNLVCNEFSLPWSTIIKRDRRRNVVDAKKAYCFLAIEYLKQTCMQTGKDLHKDHTTAIYLRRAARKMIDINDDLAYKIDNIKKSLYENKD